MYKKCLPWLMAQSMILINLSIIIIKNNLDQIWHQITDEWNAEFWGNMKGRKVEDKKQKTFQKTIESWKRYKDAYWDSHHLGTI